MIALMVNGILEDVNQNIRHAVKTRLLERGITQAELAKRLGVTPQYMSGVLTGRERELPKIWQGILGELGLTLVAVKAGERIVTVPEDAKVSITYEAEGLEPSAPADEQR